MITPADLSEVAGPSPFLRRAAFLRFDPPELHEDCFVIRAVPARLREHRRHGAGTPLGYLYEVVQGEPEQDVRFAAGHFDEANRVWSFSAEVTGIAGITEPSSPDRPAHEPPG